MGAGADEAILLDSAGGSRGEVGGVKAGTDSFGSGSAIRLIELMRVIE